MTHYYRDYTSPDKTREQHDEQAIADAREYLSDKQWATFLELAQSKDPRYSIQDLNMALGFAGVSGRPFFALMRRYRLEDFREWCRSSSGGKPVETDEQGFFLPEGDSE